MWNVPRSGGFFFPDGFIHLLDLLSVFLCNLFFVLELYQFQCFLVHPLQNLEWVDRYGLALRLTHNNTVRFLSLAGAFVPGGFSDVFIGIELFREALHGTPVKAIDLLIIVIGREVLQSGFSVGARPIE